MGVPLSISHRPEIPMTIYAHTAKLAHILALETRWTTPET